VRDPSPSHDPSGGDGGDGTSDESEAAVAGNGQTAAAAPRLSRPAHARAAPAGPTHLSGAGIDRGDRNGEGDAPARPEPRAGGGDGGDDGPGGGPDDPSDGDGDGSTPGAKHKKRKPARSLRRTVLEWAGVIGGGVVIALVIEALLVQAFWIPSPSMEPTLNVGDRVLVNKLSYRLHDVHRGDVIVFERPPGASRGGDDEIKDLIKRVVAVGGDTIESRNQLVYVNGERVDEDYLEPGTPTDNLPRQTIPEGHVFVMGDNRTNSEDSRVFGPVDEERIVGRAFMRVLPVGDIGFL
jgi:signal peptidase I